MYGSNGYGRPFQIAGGAQRNAHGAIFADTCMVRVACHLLAMPTQVERTCSRFGIPCSDVHQTAEDCKSCAKFIQTGLHIVNGM